MVEADKMLRVENPANSPMHYENRVNVGVITPPDYLPVKNLYSYFDGVNLFKPLDYDTYVMQNKVKPNKGKFPSVLKILATLITGIVLLKYGKKGIKKIFGK